MKESAGQVLPPSDGLLLDELSEPDTVRARKSSAVSLKKPATQSADESPALKRRRQRIALIEEYGGHAADLKQVASEAMRRGMYSPRTNKGDVELSLLRTWKLRKRLYAR